MDAPNVLLVVFDTARADALEPYGAPAGSSPVVADLARSGWMASSAYATSNWTLPSHVSLFTGLLPRQAWGEDGAARDTMPRHQARALPTVLSRLGFETKGVSANPWVSKAYGFDAGFDTFRLVRRPRKHVPGAGTRARLKWSYQAARARVDDGLRQVQRAVDGWIAEGQRRPFFWFANLMECHSPYLPPRPYNDLGPVERWAAGRDARIYQSHEAFLRSGLGGIDVPARSLSRMRHLYARAVRSMDDWLGRTLEQLDRAKLLSETIVIVTSDHGENLGESGLLGHTLSMDERLVHVPFVAGGGVPIEGRGDLMSLASVPSMLARTMGTDHPWIEDPLPGGVAVAQNLGGKGDVGGVPFLRFLEDDPGAMAVVAAPRDCATDGRFKLVRVGSSEALYDLRDDPGETADLLARHPAEAERLRGALNAVSEASPAGTVGRRSEQELDADEVADLEERMRLLGYM